jgi:hypothetical protein
MPGPAVPAKPPVPQESCPACARTVARGRLLSCPLCKRIFCEHCAVARGGRNFCGSRCGDTYFFGGDEGEVIEEE